ncbi:MAG: hypothetical protein ACFCBW_11125 [Candidatus Competibacterales bacterium]
MAIFHASKNPRAFVQQQLRQQLSRLQRVSHRRHGGSGLDPRHAPLSAWQIQRLRTTYADLLASPRYGQAVEFFCDELYGPVDFARRDHTFERIYPSMVRWLPADALHTVAMAMELNALSCELDQQLVDRLFDTPEVGAVEAKAYVEAYRQCDNYTDRERQIRLVARLGADLERLVQLPLIHTTLKLSRKPAQLMGFGEMQHMLERGFGAFRQMKGSDAFIHTVVQRELTILQRIFARHPEPFAVP